MRAALIAASGLTLVLGAGLAVRGLAAPRAIPPAVLARALACAGHERWQIKTLTDAQANQVNTSVTATSVEALRANDTRPAKVSAKVGRIHPVEFRRYRVQATIDQAFREDDGDLHVVIHDRANDGQAAAADTMIAEFPNPLCEPQKSSAYVQLMSKARDNFVNYVKRCTGYTGTFGSPITLGGHASVTGVGFWDIKHGTPQRGHAPNDIELHPVLKFTRARCD